MPTNVADTCAIVNIQGVPMTMIQNLLAAGFGIVNQAFNS